MEPSPRRWGRSHVRAILHVGKSWWGNHHIYSACEIQASPCHLKECCPHAYVRARRSWEPCRLKEERGAGLGLFGKFVCRTRSGAGGTGGPLWAAL